MSVIIIVIIRKCSR